MAFKCLIVLFISSALSTALIFFLITIPSLHTLFPSFLTPPPSSISSSSPRFVESRLRPSPPSSLPTPPRFAYLISGSSGDGKQLRRTLLALYHPLNSYVVHLDLEAPPKERFRLYKYLSRHPVFSTVGNVRMITKANLVTYRGPTMVTNTLHAAAILLKERGDWDWFINLSASDYPLVTQDDMLHTFSNLPRDLNFIDHTSSLGWKERGRANPIMIDPGLYMLKKHDVFMIPGNRSVPTSFKLFTAGATCISLLCWVGRSRRELGSRESHQESESNTLVWFLPHATIFG